jgi:cardiolipin synthase
MHNEILWIYGVISTTVHILGIFSAYHSIMHTKTAQSAVAWSIALVTVPYVTLPLYWVFSRNKFHGYVQAFRSRNRKIKHLVNDLRNYMPEYVVGFEEDLVDHQVLERLAELPMTCCNSARLLIDGGNTFDAIFKGIDEAKDYILVQFYIIHDDKLGIRFREKLIEAAGRGVRVYLLYDEIGSYYLPNAYIEKCMRAGIDIRAFKTAKGKSNRFQVNFRNHRKIVVIDGHSAFVGGLNVGDEYMGLDKRLSPWRDTHMMIKGPSVQCVQVTFIEDWYWATDSVPKLNWEPKASDEGVKVLVFSTGPADDFETCDLFFVNSINGAKKRVWIASPYFVPDPQTVTALQLAALRGVDVRILVPKNWDKKYIWMAAFSFFKETLPAGVKIFFYEEGFMHQKVMLIDDDIASVGTANFDNRSFRWNFEISLIIADSGFCAETEKMLKGDLKRSKEIKMEDFDELSLWFNLQVRVTRLISQVL